MQSRQAGKVYVASGVQKTISRANPGDTACYLVAIEALVSDLHPSAKCPDRGHLLDCKSDSLGSRGEATVMGRRAPPDTLVLWHKQLGR
jgi:hypothetical protein